MDTDKKPDSSEAAGSGPSAPKSSSLRRLLQAGLGASPAVLTIVSQPVRAFGPPTAQVCRSASSFASNTAAVLAGVKTSGAPVQSCLGNGPIAWSTLSASAWPVVKGTLVPGDTTGALFNTYFPSGYTFRGNSAPRFIDIVGAAPGSGYTEQETVVRSFAAAMLNNLSTPKLTPDEVVTQLQLATIFPQVMAGTYTPIAGGTPWTLTLANRWFLQTFATT